jgi:Domain of unknown function (DUF4276)
MKIGIICEGGLRGADIRVYKFLAEQILSDVKIIPAPLDSKPKLIDQCGEVSKALLELDACERIIIIWDLQPAWKAKGQKACRKNDCDSIKQSLNAAQLNDKQLEKVHPVCMEQELETLFLTDEQTIAMYFTQKSGRNCRVKYFKYPEHPQNAKGEVDKIFQMHSGRIHRYTDMTDAEKMIQLVTINKLKRCASFVRFATKIADERMVSRLLCIPLTQLIPNKKPQNEEF